MNTAFEVIKKIAAVIMLLLPSFWGSAQKHNWQNLDLHEDSVFGISTEKAYRELLVHKKAVTVLVAVIDGGVDTSHEDLKAVIWNNPGEKPGNGIDDDHNGYVDDLHGWDFIGGPKGDVHYDNLEMVRIIRRDAPRYDSLTAATVTQKDRAGWEPYKKMGASLDQKMESSRKALEGINRFKEVLDGIFSRMIRQPPRPALFQKNTPRAPAET